MREDLCLEAKRNRGSERRFMSGSVTEQRIWKRNKTEEVREDLCLEAERNRGSERRFMSGSGAEQRNY